MVFVWVKMIKYQKFPSGSTAKCLSSKSASNEASIQLALSFLIQSRFQTTLIGHSDYNYLRGVGLQRDVKKVCMGTSKEYGKNLGQQ